MEAKKNTVQRQVQAARPGSLARPPHHLGRRPSVDGFAIRRPQHGTPNPAVSMRPQPTTAPLIGHTAIPHRLDQPVATTVPVDLPATPQATLAATTPVVLPPMPAVLPEPVAPYTKTRGVKVPHRSAHASLVGLALFILGTALLLSPLIPGLVTLHFPLTAVDSTTGEQPLPCISLQGPLTTSTTYTRKLGTPISYGATATLTQSATCNGRTVSVITGHTVTFNPLGALLDTAIAFVFACALAHVWRLARGAKPHTGAYRDY